MAASATSAKMWDGSNNPRDDDFFTPIHSMLHGVQAFADSINSDTFSRAFHGGRYSGSMRSSGGFTTAVDLLELPDKFQLTADLPGVKKSDVTLSIHENQMCLAARREPVAGAPSRSSMFFSQPKDESEKKGEQYLLKERREGEFQRCWTLQNKIQEGDVKATLNDGVLQVEVKKGDTSVPRFQGSRIHIS
eukprot:Sspe_Gene.50415::Locus_28025_Transcript_3_4_Confidence_0.400_Length_734::g.50415::m.50415/K13993/HSP20; HSP20 family protein